MFATSAKRCQLLDGWLRYREELRKLGVVGFQWLDGSFCEDLRARVPPEPGDIDVVTLYGVTQEAAPTFGTAITARTDLHPGALAKTTYGCDVYYVTLATPHGDASVKDVHYWYGLLSHRRGDEAWKGFLEVALPTTPTADDAARAMLATMTAALPQVAP